MGQMSTLKMECSLDNQIVILSCLQNNNVGGGNSISDGQNMVSNLTYAFNWKLYLVEP